MLPLSRKSYVSVLLVMASLIVIHNLKGIQLLAKLRLGLSHLSEHEFSHKFQDTVNLICDCDEDIETS